MSELGIVRRSSRRRPRTTNSPHGFFRYPNRVLHPDVVRPEQVWVADISYIRLRQEFVSLAVLMDVFTLCGGRDPGKARSVGPKSRSPVTHQPSNPNAKSRTSAE